MKTGMIFLLLILSYKIVAQSDPKVFFQKTRYELAVSSFRKADYTKALELFSLASNIKRENEVGKESIKKIDTLKILLRKCFLRKVVGTWQMTGSHPLWSNDSRTMKNISAIQEIIQITKNQIMFYEVHKDIKKLIRTEDLKFYNKEQSDALFSAIILADGTIWNCSLNEDNQILHTINIAKKIDNAVTIIKYDNLEKFYSRIKQ